MPISSPSYGQRPGLRGQTRGELGARGTIWAVLVTSVNGLEKGKGNVFDNAPVASGHVDQVDEFPIAIDGDHEERSVVVLHHDPLSHRWKFQHVAGPSDAP